MLATKGNKKAIVVASRWFGLQVNADSSKYTVMSGEQHDDR